MSTSTGPDAAVTAAAARAAGRWLPPDFQHPTRVAVTREHHLRPITAADADLDLAAVTANRARLFAVYGVPWSWPPMAMTREQDEADLAHHEQEIRDHLSFNYALFDTRETQMLGCLYLEPATRTGYDAEVSWWIVEGQVGNPLETALDAFVPTWVRLRWPFTRPAYPGRDISWTAYLALPAA